MDSSASFSRKFDFRERCSLHFSGSGFRSGASFQIFLGGGAETACRAKRA